MGFFAMLLGNILFLTSVWHYSILRAGLAVTPGPLVVAVVSGSAGKLAARVGFRRVLTVGFVVFALGVLWYVARVGLGAHYVTRWLPGTFIVGLGIGLTFPVMSAAAVSRFDPARYSVGSAVNQTARQIGRRSALRFLSSFSAHPQCISRTAQLSALVDLHRVLGGHCGTLLFAPAWWREFNNALECRERRSPRTRRGSRRRDRSRHRISARTWRDCRCVVLPVLLQRGRDLMEPTEDAPAPPKKRSRKRGLTEWLIVLVIAVLASLLVRTYVVQTYFIPSKSMKPTLYVGNRIMVDKLAVEFGHINIGDIVVFKAPPEVAIKCGDTVPNIVKRDSDFPVTSSPPKATRST